MINFEVKYSKDLDLWDVEDELYYVKKEFIKHIDKELFARFRKEYGQKKSYYNAIRRIRERPKEHRFLANTGHIGLWRMVEDPEIATSQKGIKRSERKQVRLIRGYTRGNLPKRFFKSIHGVHARKDKWFLKKELNFYDYFADEADKLYERCLHD